MQNKNTSDSGSGHSNSPADDGSESQPDDLIVGSITFIIFLVFMTVWMVFVDAS